MKSPQTLRLKFAPQPLPIPEPTTVDALLQAGGVAGKGYFAARWTNGSARNGDLSTLARSLPKYCRSRFYLVLWLDEMNAPGVSSASTEPAIPASKNPAICWIYKRFGGTGMPSAPPKRSCSVPRNEKPSGPLVNRERAFPLTAANSNVLRWINACPHVPYATARHIANAHGESVALAYAVSQFPAEHKSAARLYFAHGIDDAANWWFVGEAPDLTPVTGPMELSAAFLSENPQFDRQTDQHAKGETEDDRR